MNPLNQIEDDLKTARGKIDLSLLGTVILFTSWYIAGLESPLTFFIGAFFGLNLGNFFFNMRILSSLESQRDEIRNQKDLKDDPGPPPK